ncbi:hypothetical protein DFQ27_005770 [Actinomortierella ambigua]|uniref:Uncharacterized protein n=1 Tax=Actinomortierella ambigua TaxID=1343610 RepID=A0A9P6Q022_9FUNG|nr:hypothetical protein DFQ27_005770 [Actinomortierella ambigua]
MFEWGGSAWWATRSSEPVLEGSVLSAGLFDENDRPVHAKVNLAERIRNINGKLTYSDKPLKSQGVNPDITKSCRDFKLRDGYTLTAICLTEVSTKIDTNHLLGNWKAEGIKNINGRLTYVGPANQSSAAI